jgi:hypothetical protein
MNGVMTHTAQATSPRATLAALIQKREAVMAERESAAADLRKAEEAVSKATADTEKAKVRAADARQKAGAVMAKSGGEGGEAERTAYSAARNALDLAEEVVAVVSRAREEIQAKSGAAEQEIARLEAMVKVAVQAVMLESARQTMDRLKQNEDEIIAFRMAMLSLVVDRAIAKAPDLLEYLTRSRLPDFSFDPFNTFCDERQRWLSLASQAIPQWNAARDALFADADANPPGQYPASDAPEIGRTSGVCTPHAPGEA